MFRVKIRSPVLPNESLFAFISFELERSKIRYVKAFTAKRAFTYLICVVITYLRLPFLGLISSEQTDIEK